MFSLKKHLKGILSLSVICISLSGFAITTNALDNNEIKSKTVNTYNIYNPFDILNKSNLNTDTKTKSIQDYIIPSTELKVVDNNLNDNYLEVSTKITSDLLTSKINKETYSIDENGEVTLENNLKVTKKLLNKNYTVGKTLNPEYIIIHDTGNRSSGANANSHYNYWSKPNSAKASAHYVVDSNTVMQLLEHNQVAWHTGFLFTSNPEVPQAKNGNSIGIELCVNEDGDFTETMKNGIALTKYLMDLYDIPAEKVITHNQSTGKICPAMMIKDNPALWKLFKAEISSSNEETMDVLATP